MYVVHYANCSSKKSSGTKIIINGIETLTITEIRTRIHHGFNFQAMHELIKCVP